MVEELLKAKVMAIGLAMLMAKATVLAMVILEAEVAITKALVMAMARPLAMAQVKLEAVKLAILPLVKAMAKPVVEVKFMVIVQAREEVMSMELVSDLELVKSQVQMLQAELGATPLVKALVQAVAVVVV